jgi:hypothetical protein
MNVKTNPTFAIVNMLKFWPWLVVLSLLVLVVWLLRLGSEPQPSETPSEAAMVIAATAQQSTVTATSRQETSDDATVAAQVANGEVYTAPNSGSPVGNDTFSIKDRAHALVEWVSGLVSETPTANSSVTLATPPSSTFISTTPKQAAIETAVTVEAPVADGEVDPVPVVSHLPVAHGEVRNQDRVHAGDDSMYLKDDVSGSVD